MRRDRRKRRGREGGTEGQRKGRRKGGREGGKKGKQEQWRDHWRIPETESSGKFSSNDARITEETRKFKSKGLGVWGGVGINCLPKVHPLFVFLEGTCSQHSLRGDHPQQQFPWVCSGRRCFLLPSTAAPPRPAERSLRKHLILQIEVLTNTKGLGVL